MTAPAMALAPLPALFPTTARAAAGHAPSALTIVLLVVIIAGVLAVTYDLSVHGRSRAVRTGTEPQPPATPDDARSAASHPEKQS